MNCKQNNNRRFFIVNKKSDFLLLFAEMARDSAVGRERILVVPSSLALDNTTANQHVTGAQNELNQQILEVRIFQIYPSTKLSNESVS